MLNKADGKLLKLRQVDLIRNVYVPFAKKHNSKLYKARNQAVALSEDALHLVLFHVLELVQPGGHKDTSRPSSEVRFTTNQWVGGL